MALVVGGAVVRHGLVLAARRTWPAEHAGRWELPGGKVEAGETPDAALVRELHEELGVTTTVIRWLTGEQPVGGGRHTLRAALVALADDREPASVDHDELRWLSPEQLDPAHPDAVDWLEPDRPFLAELREHLLDGEPLAGGHAGGAVRIGDTVRRPSGPWTPATGDTGMQALAATGEPERTERALAGFRERRSAIGQHLRQDRPVRPRGIFFDEDDARAVARQLLSDGFDADVEREPFAGEDDDEDHPWAVTTDAPDFVLEVLVDRHDGWLDAPDPAPPAGSPPGPPLAPPRAPLDLPDAPRRLKRPPV